MARKRLAEDYPPWLKKRIPAGGTAAKVREILSGLRLNTVCGSALCPNIAECFHSGTATFLIMGPNCTRACAFCAVERGEAAALDPAEPGRVAEAAALLGLKHVVVTSVTRDDLADGGAAHFAATIGAIRSRCDATVEVLTSDFAGSQTSVETVVAAGPDVFNHNVETVERLYGAVRPQADYARSLGVLSHAAQYAARVSGVGRSSRSVKTKSGIMVGVGETIEEVEGVLADLFRAGVRIVTVGQYLRPSVEHLAVARYVTPEEFARLERRALEMGFEAAFSAPFVRSSYHAGEVFEGTRRR